MDAQSKTPRAGTPAELLAHLCAGRALARGEQGALERLAEGYRRVWDGSHSVAGSPGARRAA